MAEVGIKPTITAETKVEPEVKTEVVETKVEAKVESEVKTEEKVEAKPQPKAPTSDWRDDRIRVLTAKLADLRAAKPTATSGDPAKPDPAAIEAEITKRADELAEVKASQAAFNRECNEMIEQGKKDFEDFEERRVAFTKLNDPSDAEGSQRYWTLIQAALDTGEGPRIIHDLGADLNEAARLMKLSPTKLGIELARLAAKPADEGVSEAPKPITPVGQRTVSHVKIEPDDSTRSDALSTAEWMARREAQLKERYGDGRRRVS